MKLMHMVLLTALFSTPLLAQDQPAPGTRGKRGAVAAAPGTPVDRPARGVPAAPGITTPVEEPGHAADVAGQWKGLYVADPAIMVMDLDLRAADDGRSFTGEVHFTTLYDQAQRRFTHSAEGSWRVDGKYFPGSRTIALIPKGWIKQPTEPSPQPQAMSGVYSLQRKELAGQLESRFPQSTPLPYFVFVRADDSGDGPDRIKTLADHLASMGAVTRPGPTTNPAPAPGSGPGSALPDDDALTAWAARYDQEYPGSAAKDSLDKVSAQGVPLLSDAVFKPAFGETYDAIDLGLLARAMDRFAGRTTPVNHSAEIREMQQKAREQLQAAKTQEERAAINKELQAMILAARTGGPKPNLELKRQLGYMEYVLRPTAGKIVTIAAMRTLDAWEAETLARFKSEPPTATTFTDMAAAQQAIKARVAYAWPSDRKRTDDEFEQIRAKVGGPALAASADHAIAAAGGLSGAKALAAWAKENQALLNHASPEDRSAAVAKVDAALDKLLQEQLSGPLAQLGKLGTGVDAINGAAVWYRDFQARFAFAADRPPVRDALAKLQARRPADLAAAQDPLIRGLEACKQTAQVDEMVARELSIPGDNQTKPYPVILAAAGARKKEIEKQALLALFSDGERKLMDRPGHVDLSRYHDEAPTAEEVRLAVLRSYAAGGDGKMIDAHTARHVARQGSPLMFPYPLLVTITDEKLKAFQPVPNTKNFRCAFTCVMKVAIADDNMIANYDANTRKGSDQMAALANALSKLASDDERIMDFRLYDDGWGIPGAKEGAAIIDLMGKSITGH